MRSRWLRDKALPLAAWAVVLFLHIPLALIILYAFSAEDKSFVFPPPALTLQWFTVAWGRDDVWAAIRLSFSVPPSAPPSRWCWARWRPRRWRALVFSAAT